MGYAFISYNSNNRALTDKLLHIFNKNGISSWIAPDDIPVGARYAQVINKAIRNCGCFILLLTQESVNSQWVAKEVERAIDYKKPIVPIRLEDVALTDDFALYISTDQILSVNHFDERSPEIQNLLGAVTAYTGASSYEKEDLVADFFNNERVGNLPQEKAPQEGKTRAFPKGLIFGICALILALAIVLATVLSGGRKEDPGKELPSPNDTVSSIHQSAQAVTPADTQPETTADAIQTTAAETTAGTNPAGENEIPSKFENEVTALMYADEMSKGLRTIRLKVGEFATPSAASVWGDVTIYSQDTSIAIGEGILVKGVSRGETYILIESAVGSTTAYYIIVE